jgi:hypothetical protein
MRYKNTDMLSLLYKIEMKFIKRRDLHLIKGVALTVSRNGSVLISVARRFSNMTERGRGLCTTAEGIRWQDLDSSDYSPIIELKKDTDEETAQAITEWIRSECCEPVGQRRHAYEMLPLKELP